MAVGSAGRGTSTLQRYRPAHAFLTILPQLGLDVKTKLTEELTETVDVTEEVDEEQQIQGEVGR
jgi:hypothetical protein